MKATALLAVIAVAFALVPATQAIDDTDILNFALNLEYLEATFYHYAVYGTPLPSNLTGGGPATIGGQKTTFNTKVVKQFATELATDEYNHVAFLRTALGSAAVPIPELNIGTAFSTAADVALNTTLSPPFSPYMSNKLDLLFLHGAFIFEDVGVTAYNGAAALISSKDYLSAAAGILAVEAYHAGAIRTFLYTKAETFVVPYYPAKVVEIVAAISKLRGKVGGGSDMGIVDSFTMSNIVPANKMSIAYDRTPAEVIAIVTLASPNNKGGFFPKGLNGNIK